MSISQRHSAILLAVALFLPASAAWLYFVILDGHRLAGIAYAVCKTVQFALPLLVLSTLLAARPPRKSSASAALGLGAATGAAMLLLLLASYAALSGDGALVADAASRIDAKMADFGIGGPVSYLTMAVFLSFLHSFLEEYYWRWFVFGRLRTHLGLRPALILSSLGFMAHHVIVVSRFFSTEATRGLVVPASLAVGAAGAVWALLYHRTGRLLAPWLSHVVADLAVMGVGYHLLWLAE